MKIVLPYPPSANLYWRYVKGKVLRSEGASIYRETVGWHCLAQHVEKIEGDVAVTLHLYRPQRSGDLDNRIKQLLDAMRGYAYEDDDQVVEIHAYRHDDKNDPRAEVDVTPV